MSEDMLRTFAECRERSIVQILEREFDTHIYGICLGHTDDDAPEDPEVEQDLMDDMERIASALSNVFSDLSLTCWDAAVLIGFELDGLAEEMPYMHFHRNDYFDDEVDDGS